jgi:uncharacterized membrane protein YwzB
MDQDANENSINEDSKEINIEDPSSKINLNTLGKEELSTLRFFFGGFGDARHIFASFIDLNHEVQKLSIEKQDSVKVTFVVNDIKPHALAKLLIILVALRKLNEFEYDQIGKEIKATRAAMLLVYVYVGNIMPNYIYDELMDIIKSIIESKLVSWNFLSINDSSWIAVKKVLKQWITKCPVSNEIMMSIWKTNGCIDNFNNTQEFQGDNTQISMFKEMKASFMERLKKALEEESFVKDKNDAIQMFENFPGKEFMKTNVTLSAQDQKKFKNVKRDICFAKKYRYLLPPFLIQEEAEKSLWFKNSTNCENSDELDYEAFSFKEMTKYVTKNWKPNVTIVDYEWYMILYSYINKNK